jgi:hypothetical protein
MKRPAAIALLAAVPKEVWIILAVVAATAARRAQAGRIQL